MHLVGVEGVAYAYHPPVDSDDDESEVRVHDTWGLNVQSDDEDDVSSESSEEDEEISPSNSPPPDDAKREFRLVFTVKAQKGLIIVVISCARTWLIFFYRYIVPYDDRLFW